MADIEHTSESAPTSSCSTTSPLPTASTATPHRSRSHRKRKRQLKQRTDELSHSKPVSAIIPASVEEPISCSSPRSNSEGTNADTHSANPREDEQSAADAVTAAADHASPSTGPPIAYDQRATPLEFSEDATSDQSRRPAANPTPTTNLVAANSSTSSPTASPDAALNRISDSALACSPIAVICAQNPAKAPPLHGTTLESQLRSGYSRISTMSALYSSATSHEFQRSARDRQSGRHAGTICLLCIAVGALTASVALALLMFWWRAQDMAEPCVDFDCQLAIRYLCSLVDSDIEPCEDFYGHVCRKWDAEEGGLSFVDAAVRDLALALNWTLLSIGAGRERYYGAADFVRFYASCHAFLARTGSHGSREEKIKFPLELFANDSSILHLRDVAELLTRVVVLSLTRGISTAFGVSLVRHRGNVGLYLTRGRSLADKLGERNQTRMLVGYLRPLFDTIKLHFLENSTWLNLEDMVGAFEEFEFLLMQPGKRWRATQALEQLQVSALDSIVGVDSSVWLNVLNAAAATKPPMTQHSLLLADCLECLNSTARSFAARAQYAAVYVYSHVATEIGRFIYKRNELAPKRTANAPVACLSASRDVLPPVWSHLYSNLSYSAASADARTADIFERVLHLASKTQAASSVSIGGVEHQATTALSFPEVSTADLFLYNTTLEPVSGIPGGLFDGIDQQVWQNFPALYLAAREHEASRRLREPVTAHYAVESALLLRGHVTYQPLRRAVVVPAAMRRLPMAYPESVPVEFEMSTTGTLLATELSRIAALSQFSLQTPWTEWYRKSVNRLANCTEDIVVASMKSVENEHVENDAFELYVWSRAFHVTLGALRGYYLPKSTRGTPGSQRWLLALQTFFKRFCLLSCGAGTLGSGVGRKLRCLLPALSTMEFRYAFGCKKFRRRARCLS
ncbi:uncharacterized protein [Dermacentor albipictus]|uniref:uncharacterized protein n=1 Tax=Dermacentor albipictus TaxID=60249 RepID=UPI0031FD35AD